MIFIKNGKSYSNMQKNTSNVHKTCTKQKLWPDIAAYTMPVYK